MRAAALGVSNVLPTTLNGWVAPRKGMIRMIKPRQHVGWLAALCALVIPGVVVSAADAAVPPRERAVLAAPVRHMRAGGVDFAYRAIGSGRPLVLIDGLEATMSSEWDPAVLAQLVAHHRVVLYDHRGVGLSRGDVSSMTVAQLSDDAAALIHALHLSAPDVWGQSLGGDVAEDLVVRHPTAVRRVVLTGASAGGGEDHWIPSTVQNGPKPGDRDGIERIIFTPDAAGRAARRAFDERVARWRPHESLTPEARSAEYAAGAGFLVQPAQGVWTQLARVHAPVFVGAGRRDVVVPPGNARIIAARLPHPTLHLYPAGHYFYTQDQDRFVPDLLRFLGDNGPTS